MSKSPDNSETPARKRGNWLRFSLRSLFILVTLAGLLVGGKLQYDSYRKKSLVARWVEPLAVQAYVPVDASAVWGSWPPLPPTPKQVQPEHEIDLLRIGILELPSSTQRLAALRILVETRDAGALPILRELLGKSRHAETQDALLHLIALDQNADDIPRIEAFLGSPRAELRAAAAESLGYIYEPAYPFARGFQLWGRRVHLNTLPPIDASGIVSGRDRDSVPVQSPFDDEEDARRAQRHHKVPQRIRDRIEAQMLRGATLEERTAAARALVAWPPDKYSLRLAEWGVWIDDRQQLKLAESVLAEIPPFVHGAGNSIASLPRNRYEGMIMITKPIIHLTADRPLAVDLEVAISSGRPWFVFPRPDSFTVHLDDWFSGRRPLSEAEIDALRPSRLSELKTEVEGYPWVHPLERSEGASTALYASQREITAVGLRWQSLIVSPQRQTWMTPPVVPAAAEFAWWTALRDVPSGWIANRGEAERFLYYDGPSLARSPHVVQCSDSQLTVQVQDMFLRRPEDDRRPAALTEQGPLPDPRLCLFIDASGEQTRGFSFFVLARPGTQQSIDLPSQIWLSGDEVERRMRTILVDRGLTAAESDGLLASWQVRFFQTPGRRLVTFLSPEDYDFFCPLKIRPAASESVRVGIVLCEL